MQIIAFRLRSRDQQHLTTVPPVYRATGCIDVAVVHRFEHQAVTVFADQAILFLRSA